MKDTIKKRQTLLGENIYKTFIWQQTLISFNSKKEKQPSRKIGKSSGQIFHEWRKWITKFVKKFSTFPITRKLKIKSTVRYTIICTLKWLKCKILTIPSFTNWNLHTLMHTLITCGNTKWCSHFGKQVGHFSIS